MPYASQPEILRVAICDDNPPVLEKMQEIVERTLSPFWELIVFRDSFGSSLAPLLVQGYARVTLVDIRYLQPELLGQLLDFHGQDVLLLYSTLVLNSAGAIK